MPLLGYIRKQDRTQAQHDAHARAEAAMPRFAMAPVTLNKGDKVILQDVWKDPTVVADVGRPLTRAHQLTGSCIGASLFNTIITLSGTQRLFSVNPSKAILPFWPFDYGRCRFNEGDHGQGEGAMNSSAVDVMKREGVLLATEPGLPQYQDNGDGFVLTSALEMAWSDGASATVTKYLPQAKAFPLGTAAPCNNPQDAATGISNGYPFYYGCDYYVGNGSIKGSGVDAYVTGKFDGQGGHSTSLLAVWHHPNDGILYGYQNNWPKQTYPSDPAGLPDCAVWITEAEVAKIWSRYHGDAYLLSHLTTFPAQPTVMDWASI